jgi:1-acyl-sn-glycerol-3-phosphate acyltransferase
MTYRLLRLIGWLFLVLFNRIIIKGEENIPSSGPAVLAANHVSNWDPVVLACSVRPRIIHFMAKGELFVIPVLGKLFPLLQCFPVQRGRMDRDALRTGHKILADGGLLGIFPEGTLDNGRELLPYHQGAALFALRSGAPLIPVALKGTATTFPCSLRGRIRVHFGQPLIFPQLKNSKATSDKLREVTDELRRVTQELLKDG